MGETPPNIDEFNQIAELIFAQLYRDFPVVVDIDREAIAKVLGVSRGNWGNHMLPSGRTFNDVLSGTIGWLRAEDYTLALGPHPASRVSPDDEGIESHEYRSVPASRDSGNGVEKGNRESFWGGQLLVNGRSDRRGDWGVYEEHRKRLKWAIAGIAADGCGRVRGPLSPRVAESKTSRQLREGASRPL